MTMDDQQIQYFKTISQYQQHKRQQPQHVTHSADYQHHEKRVKVANLKRVMCLMLF